MAPVASGKASSKAPGYLNPTSAQYAAQRGSIDMLMRAKDTRPPTSTTTNLSSGAKGGEASAVSSVPPRKMSFLEAVRAQRQVRVQELRDSPKPNGPAGGILAATSSTAADPSNFHKGSGGGGFSALAKSSSKGPKAKAKTKPQAQSKTAWIAALASPSINTGANSAAATAVTTTTTATTGPSFAQVQDELEAGFLKYSRANPLGGVGASRGGDSEGGQQKQGQGQGQAQSQSQGQRTDVPMTATVRNLRARQLMVAPQSVSRREDERIAAAKKKHYNNGGDDSSDEDVGRSALGRKKARKG